MAAILFRVILTLLESGLLQEWLRKKIAGDTLSMAAAANGKQTEEFTDGSVALPS